MKNNNEKVLIIIPAYNEEENILKTYNSIINYKERKYDAIVINDGSKDHTEEILCENKIPHIKLIQNLGIGGAIQTGYKYALENGYDIAVQFDGDGQHDINYVKNIIKPIINKKANMVIGSRFVNKDKNNFQSTLARRIGINMISFVIKLKTKKKIHDTTSGFRAIDKKIIEYFANNYPTEYPEPISTVDVLLQGLTVDEVPAKMLERTGGVSSITSWKTAYYMLNVTLSILIQKRRSK